MRRLVVTMDNGLTLAIGDLKDILDFPCPAEKGAFITNFAAESCNEISRADETCSKSTIAFQLSRQKPKVAAHGAVGCCPAALNCLDSVQGRTPICSGLKPASALTTKNSLVQQGRWDRVEVQEKVAKPGHGEKSGVVAGASEIRRRRPTFRFADRIRGCRPAHPSRACGAAGPSCRSSARCSRGCGIP